MSERLSPSWRPQRQPSLLDPQVKRMALIAACVAGVAMLGVGGYSLVGGRPRQVPVIAADASPVRIRPDNPGGMQVAGADELGGSGTSEVMAPAPEAPQPQALQAEIKAAHPPAPPPAPVALAPAPALAPPPAVAALPPPAPVKPPVAKPSPTTIPAAGKVQVQLAAMDSEDGAKAEWARLAHLLPAAFSGRHPSIEKTERDGHVFWRLRTAGFTDAAAAADFCTEVKAKRAGCAIATF